MNKHIELVEKWLADNNSVSLDELTANKDAAYDTYKTAYIAHAYDATYYTFAAALAAHTTAYATYYDHAPIGDAAYYINKYKELTK